MSNSHGDLGVYLFMVSDHSEILQCFPQMFFTYAYIYLKLESSRIEYAQTMKKLKSTNLFPRLFFIKIKIKIDIGDAMF